MESGQIQLGNHTFSHPDLVGLPKDQVAKELPRDHQCLMGTYGVDGRRYYRPPYGSHNPSSTPSQSLMSHPSQRPSGSSARASAMRSALASQT